MIIIFDFDSPIFADVCVFVDMDVLFEPLLHASFASLPHDSEGPLVGATSTCPNLRGKRLTVSGKSWRTAPVPCTCCSPSAALLPRKLSPIFPPTKKIPGKKQTLKPDM
jgi:hypothetical protein